MRRSEDFEDLEYIPDWRDRVEEKLEEYRSYRKRTESAAQRELRATYLPQNKVNIGTIRPRHHVPLGNEWVTAVEEDERIPENAAREFIRHRRVLPTFYTWDEYRIYLHVIRTHADYNTVIRTIIDNGPLAKDGIVILTVFEGTDHLIPFEEDHLNIKENIFFVCVPETFTLSVKSESPFIPPLNLSMSPLETVKQLKNAIYRHRGFPKDRFDVIFDGQCMEDEERLMHYDVQNQSKVELILQTGERRSVKIFSFWQRVYYLEVDTTNTASEVINMVIKKCSTDDIGELVIQENFIDPHHILVMSSKGKTIGYHNSIQHSLEDEKVDHLILSERSSPVDEMLLEVIGLDSGTEMVKITNGGKYLSVYLNLHGVTGIPVNRMLLIGREKTLNPYDVINIERDGTTVHIQVSTRRDDDPNTKFNVNVLLPKNTLHPVRLMPTAKVEDIIMSISNFGLAEAFQYSIWYHNRELKNDTILYRINMKNRDFVHLIATRYAVYIVNSRNQKTKVMLHAKSLVDNVIQTGDTVYPSPKGRTKYIFCGQSIKTGQSAEEVKMYPGNRVYQDLDSKEIVLELRMTGRDQVQVVLQRNSIGFRYREAVAHWNLPRHVVDAVEQMLIWRVTRPSPTEVVAVRGTSLDDAYYATKDLKMSALNSHPHDPSTGVPDKRSGITQQFMMDDKTCPAPNHTQFKLPPIVLHSRPQIVNYDQYEGIRTLLHHHQM